MGTEECGGECSRDHQERPLKKAKYVWQVKGKYHLKARRSGPSPQKSEETSCRGRCIDHFLAKTETILDSDEEEDGRSTDIDRSISNDIPVTLVSPTSDNHQEHYLRKWQARQIARGYIDNTINSVLETWVSAPFDAEDFVDKCDDDGHIEDEGILMAIQAHGLQSAERSRRGETELAFLKPDQLADSTLDKIEETPTDHDSSSSDVRGNDETLYPVDILNAAILVAIEKKGLSSYNN